MSINFVLLANGTSFYIFLYVLGKAGPPIICSYKLACFQISRMSGCFMVMVME